MHLYQTLKMVTTEQERIEKEIHRVYALQARIHYANRFKEFHHPVFPRMNEASKRRKTNDESLGESVVLASTRGNLGKFEGNSGGSTDLGSRSCFASDIPPARAAHVCWTVESSSPRALRSIKILH